MVQMPVHTETILYFWGKDLIAVREALGLSQEEFADKCGWTQVNQSQLELPGIRHHLDFAKRKALRQAGIKVTTK